jgi:hypothetical protein
MLPFDSCIYDSNFRANVNKLMLDQSTNIGASNADSIVSRGDITLNGRLIADNTGPTFTGTSSRQTVQADATLDDYVGQAGCYVGGVMGNVLGTVTGTSAFNTAGLIGKYNVSANASIGPKAAVIAEIGENAVGASCDGAFVAVMSEGSVDNYPAFSVKNLNSTTGNNFSYGVDLNTSTINAALPLRFSSADIRLNNGLVVKSVTTAVTNLDATTLAAGAIVVTSNATGLGKLFISDGTNLKQLAFV